MTLSHSARVLLADDAVSHGGVVAILLENAGYDVIRLPHGGQLDQLVRPGQFDLAVLNHESAGAGGVAVAARLRALDPDLPVIVCANVFSPADEARYRELNVSELLLKPVDPFGLGAKLAPLLTRSNPEFDHHLLTAPSYRSVPPTPAAPLPSPMAAGGSKFARKLQTELLRLRDCRSIAILEGKLGCGRFELALSLPPLNARTIVRQAEDLNREPIEPLLDPSLSNDDPLFLVVTEADQLNTERQDFLEELLCGRIASYAGLAKRLRVLFCARTSLSDLNFNELLLMRGVTATLRVPPFRDRWMDWADMSRAILTRLGAGRHTFDPEAIRWIDRYLWTGDFMQLHRTIELARRLAGLADVVTIPHLESAVAAEPGCDEPLYHDLLFHVHSHAS